MASVLDEVIGSGFIKAGRLFIRDRRDFDRQVQRLKDGWEVEITVKRRSVTRSQQQNAYYWGVIVRILAEHTGYTDVEIHDVLKAKFLPKHLAITDGNGEVKGEFVLGGSTRNLKTAEFSEYCEHIKEWAADDLDVYIPDPM